MSDYLSRALDRESPGTPGVRPALPSVFEPDNASTSIAPLEMETPIGDDPSRKTRDTHHETGAEIPPARQPVVTLPGRPPVAPVDAIRAEAAVPPEPPRKRKEPTKETLVRAGHTPVAPLIVAALPAEPLLPKEQQMPGPAAAKPIVRPRVETPAGPSRAMAAKPIVRPAPESLPSAPGAAPVTAERGPTAPPAGLARETAAPESGPRPAMAPAPEPVAPALPAVPRVFPAPPRAKPARNFPVGRNAAAASRPVHITIGRIEVRAVHPSPEPVPQRPAPAPASAKISLDDYLRRRKGNAA
jgi:hypothetical protein